jgi:Cu/Ag efflux pump CusA
MPKLDEGSLLIETRRLPSTSLPEGMRIANQVERVLYTWLKETWPAWAKTVRHRLPRRKERAEIRTSRV